MAASRAVPPSLSTASPACEARWCEVATMPCVACAVCWVVAIAPPLRGTPANPTPVSASAALATARRVARRPGPPCPVRATSAVIPICPLAAVSSTRRMIAAAGRAGQGGQAVRAGWRRVPAPGEGVAVVGPAPAGGGRGLLDLGPALAAAPREHGRGGARPPLTWEKRCGPATKLAAGPGSSATSRRPLPALVRCLDRCVELLVKLLGVDVDLLLDRLRRPPFGVRQRLVDARLGHHDHRRGPVLERLPDLLQILVRQPVAQVLEDATGERPDRGVGEEERREHEADDGARDRPGRDAILRRLFRVVDVDLAVLVPRHQRVVEAADQPLLVELLDRRVVGPRVVGVVVRGNVDDEGLVSGHGKFLLQRRAVMRSTPPYDGPVHPRVIPDAPILPSCVMLTAQVRA